MMDMIWRKSYSLLFVQSIMKELAKVALVIAESDLKFSCREAELSMS